VYERPVFQRVMSHDRISHNMRLLNRANALDRSEAFPQSQRALIVALLCCLREREAGRACNCRRSFAAYQGILQTACQFDCSSEALVMIMSDSRHFELSDVVTIAIPIINIPVSRTTSIFSSLEPMHSHRKPCDNNVDMPTRSWMCCRPIPWRLRSEVKHRNLRSASRVFLAIAPLRTASRMLAD
jgi:hypothetical protein